MTSEAPHSQERSSKYLIIARTKRGKEVFCYMLDEASMTMMKACVWQRWNIVEMRTYEHKDGDNILIDVRERAPKWALANGSWKYRD